jgi:hypothetical protein
MPTEQSPPQQLNRRPGPPHTWSIESTAVDVDGSVERLVVVSDLHAYREPLDAVDGYLSELTDVYQLFVNGGILEGGMLERYARRDDLNMRMDFRRVWVSEAFLNLVAMARSRS